jgi:hypothetical protein
VHPNESADHHLDMPDIVPGTVQRVTGRNVPPPGTLGQPCHRLCRQRAQVRSGERFRLSVVHGSIR